MKNGLERSLSNIAIEVQTGTRDVVLEGDYISGVWQTRGTIHRVGTGRAIALDVLNPFLGKSSLADAILLFTKKFGPLTIPYRRSSSFRFSIREWKAARRVLHFAWKAASTGAKGNRDFTIPLDAQDCFNLENGQATFRTQKLITFAALEIASIPADRLKTCENRSFGCESPFFFASDLREKYCSEACAHESKKRKKLKWWNENRREKKSGTQKTR